MDQPRLSAPEDAIRVLHVDDEEDQLDFAKTFLAFCDSSIGVESVLTPKEALERLEEGGVDCVVSDYQMPGMDGIELARRIRETSGIPIIIYTGRGSEEVAEAAFTVGIDDYIRKEMNPSHYQVLANRILQSVDKWRTGEFQRVLVRCLETLNRPHAIEARIGDLLSIIKRFTGIEAVGIRLRMGHDYPYYVTDGFPDAFTLMESSLCAHDLEGQLIRDELGSPVLECMCGNILHGRFDPSLPFFTEGGSFWTNNTTALLESTTEEDRQARTRNRCNAEGYESVALIPVPAGDENIGLLQLNDSRPGRFGAGLIGFLEGLGGSIGMALSKSIVEDSLRSERDNAQRYLDIVGAMLVGLDRDGRVTLLNRRAGEILGCDPGEALGKDWFDSFIPSSISDDLKQKFARYMEGEDDFGERYENPVYTASGEQRTIAWFSITLRDDEGNVVGSLSSGADITDYRRLMEELKHSEANYRNLVEMAGEAVVVVQDGMLRYTNPTASEIIGYSHEELASKPLVDFIHPDDREKVVEKSLRMLSGEDSDPIFSFRFVDDKGDDKHCEVNTVPITWEGKPATLNLLRDTTGIQRMGRRLETLHSYGSDISKANTIDEIADLTHQAVDAVLGFNRGSFSIVDGDHLVHEYLWGITPERAEPLHLDGPGVTVRAVRTGESQLVNDTSNDPDYVVAVFGNEIVPNSSELAVPVKMGNEVIAVINVESERTDAFTVQDSHLVEIMAEHVSSAVNRARRSKAEARYLDHLEALHDHASRIAQAQELEEISSVTLDILEKVLGYGFVSFQIVEDDVLKTRGTIGRPSLNMPLPIDGRGVTTRAAREAHSILLDDVRGDPDFIKGSTDSLSELAVPALVDGRAVAVLNVESEELSAFNENDTQLIETLAMHVASAIENIRRADDKDQYRNRLEGLHKHSIELSMAKDVMDVAERTFEAIEQVLGFDTGSFALVEDDVIRHIYTSKIRMDDPFVQPLDGRGVIVRAVRMTETQLVQNTREDEDFVLGPDRGSEPLSELVVPVKVGGDVLAIINVESRELSAFDEDDAKLIETFAEHVSSALRRINDYGKHLQYEEKLETLNEHTVRLNRAQSLEEVLEATYDAMKRCLHFEVIDVIEVKDGVLIDAYAHGPSHVELPLTPDGMGITARAAMTRTTQFVPDVREDAAYVVGEFETLSEMAVPVVVGGETAVVLNVESTKVNDFDGQDRKLLETLAIHVATSIERLRQEELLRESEERYRRYLESSRDGVFVLVEGRYAYVNQMMVDLLGYSTQDEMMKTLPIEHVAPEDRPRALTMITERPKGIAHPELYEIKLIHRNGSILHVENHVSLIEFEENPATLVITRDISDRRDYEAKLEALHDHSTRLATADSIDEIEMISRQTLISLFGIDRGSFALVDHDLLDVRYRWNMDNPTPFVMPLDGPGITVRAANTGESQLVDDVTLDPDYYTRMPNRANITLSELAVPVKSGDDVIAVINIESTELAAFTRDDQRLTEIFAEHVASALERIQSQDALDAMREAHHNELIRGIQRVSSMVRHDLRGPLQTVMNAAYLMKSDSGKVEEMIGIIEGSVSHASGVMDDWRNQGILEGLDLSDVDLRALVNNALDNIIIPANIEVSVDVEPLTLLLDRIKMMRTLDNLIRNAVEAMPDGGTLSISAARQGNTVNLEVSDTGEGISETSLRNLFQPFYTTKAMGMGLGLVYCKRAVEAHKGEISADSTRGEGTTFSVALPLSRED